MSFESCTHPSASVLKNRIRAETHIAGYVMKPSTTRPGSTDMCIISQLDIKVKKILKERLINFIGKYSKGYCEYGCRKSACRLG